MNQVLTPQGFQCWMRKNTSDEKVFKEIFEDKIYEKKKLGFGVEAGEHWIDCGANCGYFSQWALEKGATVLAVDADYENAPIIEKLHSYENFGGLIKRAIVPDNYPNQTVSFFKRMDGNTWKSSLWRVAKSKKVTVNVIKFSSLLKSKCCVKMDIEGAEIPILQTHKDWSNVEKLVFEWSFDKEPRLKKLGEVIKELKKSFRTVYCPQQSAVDGVEQLWRGAANQFALVYCIK